MKGLQAGVFVYLCVSLISCGDKPKIGPYRDPYDDAFRNKQILYMVSHRIVSIHDQDVDITDTTWFDEAGNAERFVGYGLWERKAYDSLNFPVRYLRMDDIPKNFLIRYFFKDGVLIQQWNELKHIKWNLQPEDFYAKIDTVKFLFDGKGNIIRQDDGRSDEYTVFEYDAAGRLIKKEMRTSYQDVHAGTWSYTYTEQGNIETISLRYRDQYFVRHYYNNGFLDSTRTEENLRVYYTYIFR